MTKQADDRKSVRFEATHRANISADEAHLLDRAEHWLRPADHLDYTIRRWVNDVRKAEASKRSNVRLSEFQAAIGRHLRAQYDDLAQPIPARLVELLSQLEQRNNGSEGAARGVG